MAPALALQPAAPVMLVARVEMLGVGRGFSAEDLHRARERVRVRLPRRVHEEAGLRSVGDVGGMLRGARHHGDNPAERVEAVQRGDTRGIPARRRQPAGGIDGPVLGVPGHPVEPAGPEGAVVVLEHLLEDDTRVARRVRIGRHRVPSAAGEAPEAPRGDFPRHAHVARE